MIKTYKGVLTTRQLMKDFVHNVRSDLKNSVGTVNVPSMAKINPVREAITPGHETGKRLSDKKVIVTLGLTIENLDDVRVVKNRSSGKMGGAVAKEALDRGAKVTLICGSATAVPPTGAKVIQVKTTKEMYDVVVSELKLEKCDLLIATAVADIWAPRKPSDQTVASSTKQVPERRSRDPLIVDMVKRFSPETFLVAFRAERGVSNEELIESAFRRLKAANADLIAANDVGRVGAGFGSDMNELFLVDPARNVTHIPLATKKEVARRLLDLIEEQLYG